MSSETTNAINLIEPLLELKSEYSRAVLLRERKLNRTTFGIEIRCDDVLRLFRLRT